MPEWETLTPKAGPEWETISPTPAPAGPKPILNPVGETIAALVTGAAAAPLAGIGGMFQGAKNLLSPGMSAGDRVSQLQELMTYQPRSEGGRDGTHAVAAPFEWLAGKADQAGGAVAEATGSPAAGAAVNTAIQAAPMAIAKVAGKSGLLRESAASIAERGKQASLNAPVDAGIAQARDARLAITPTQANAGITARTIESLAGSPRLEKLLSKQNAPVINDLIRKDIGAPVDVPITREGNAQIRADSGLAYDAVKNSGEIVTDGRYRADLANITRSHEMAARDFEHRSENPFQAVMDGLNKKSFDAASAVEEVKLLRKDADKAYGNKDKALGGAYKDAAKALDDMLDRHLQKLSMTGDMSGDPALANAVAQYQAARTRIAKTYAADKALNETTGNIDANVYAAELKRNKPLSGPALTVAEFARQFPKSAQYAERIGPTGPTIHDLLTGVLGKEAALAFARPTARAALASGPIQGLLTSPQSYARPILPALAERAAGMPLEYGIPLGSLPIQR